jgi:hypothetical protein
VHACENGDGDCSQLAADGTGSNRFSAAPRRSREMKHIIHHSDCGTHAVNKQLAWVVPASSVRRFNTVACVPPQYHYCSGNTNTRVESAYCATTMPYVMHHSDCDTHAVNKQLSCVRVLFVCGLCTRWFASHHNSDSLLWWERKPTCTKTANEPCHTSFGL